MIMKKIYIKYISLLLVLFFIKQIGAQGFSALPDTICSRGMVTLTYTPSGQVPSEIELYRDNILINNTSNIFSMYSYLDYPLNNTGGTITITYSIEVTMTDGTVITDNASVVVYPAPQLSVADFIVSDVSCNGGQNGSIIPNIDYFTGNNSGAPFLYYSNTFLNTSYTLVTTTNFNLSGLPGGDYYFFIRENNQLTCNSDTITITVNEPQSISYDSVNIIDDNCGQHSGMVIFHGLTGGVSPYIFTDGSTITYDNINDSVIINLTNNFYQFTIIDANNCSYNLLPPNNQSAFIISNSVNGVVPETPNLPQEQTVCENQSLQLNDNSGLPHFYYFSGSDGTLFYSPTSTINIQNQTLLQNDSLYVYVIETTGTSAGCISDIVAIDLIQKDCSFNPDSVSVTYNAFSPNDQQNPENNTFVIDLEYIDDPNVTDVNVTIYNRWGDIVYQTENYNNKNGWNGGTFNESALPEGTYYYIIKVNSKKYVKSGWVYLDR